MPAPRPVWAWPQSQSRRLVAVLPGQPRFRLELAAPDHQLRNYDAARRGYQAVQARADLPQVVRRNLEAPISAPTAATRRHSL